MTYVHQKIGFTLIELLIVVAIIAILAAIAVPNFLEAQTRAKVSRAKADMRTIATGLEAYRVDYNEYPPNPDTSVSFNITPSQITTPIAYLTSRPQDPFKTGKNVTQASNPALYEERFFYDYYAIISTDAFLQAVSEGTNVFLLSADASGAFANLLNRGAFQKYGGWLQWSVGPDAVFWNVTEDFNNPNDPSAGLAAPAHLPFGYSFDLPYDPTNGTISFGNIIRTQKVGDGAGRWEP